MQNQENPVKKESTLQQIADNIGRIYRGFINFLKPTPTDHWAMQVLKSLAKIPLVLLLILFSPVLVVVLLIVFIIAL